MKKILTAAALALLLAACANKPKIEDPQPRPATAAEALTQCQAATGEQADRAAFDACMKDKGFRRTASAQPPEEIQTAAPETTAEPPAAADTAQ